MHPVRLIGRRGTTAASSSSSSSSSSSNVVAFFTLMMASCFVFQMNQAQITPPNNITIPALIAFGDSIIDAGNNNHLKTLVKCNFPPYGRDFKGGIPTGRFSNGKVPTDFLVEDLGIKELLPAYLDPSLKPSDLLTGVSFASGSCGYDPLTSQMMSVLSLSDQLNLFREYKKKLKKIAGEKRTKSIIAESFYAICTGSDDIANTYFSTLLRSVNYDVPAYTDLMIRSASSFIQELYGLGARRIGVLDIPPIGCVPAQRTLAGGQERECAEKFNQAASLFNTKLSSLIDSLNKKLPQSKIVFIDIYQPLLDIIQYPDSYGFEDVNNGCCGTGRLEVSILCNSLVPQTCKNDSRYLFWDSYHPSERAYRFLTTVILQDNINQFF